MARPQIALGMRNHPRGASCLMVWPTVYWRRVGAGLLAALAVLFLLAGAGWAVESKPVESKPLESRPVDAKVGFELLSIRNVNILAGEFEATFNLSFNCSAECEPSGFMLENGRILSAVPVVNQPGRKLYFVRSQNMFDVATRKIPFDEQTLEIRLRTENAGIRYSLDRLATPVDLDLSVVDWAAGKTLQVSHESSAALPGEASSFRSTYRLTVHRPAIWSLLRFMLPALALMVSAFLVLILPDDFKSRLGMSLAAFIGLIFLQLSVGGRVPVRDGLPLWDKYLLISYVAVALVILYLFLDNALKEKELTRIRERVTFYMRALLPASWAVLQSIVAIATLR